MATLKEIVAEIDRRVKGRPLGGMQAFRTETKGLKLQYRKVFYDARDSHYAFHKGGRTELQFNLGLDDNAKGGLRYGVAF